MHRFVCVCVCVHKFLTRLVKYQGMLLLDHHKSMFSFVRIAHCLPKYPLHFTFLVAVNDHSCCSTPLPAFGVICSSFMLEKTLESPMDCKEISPGCSLEGMMLKLKLQYFGHLMSS